MYLTYTNDSGQRIIFSYLRGDDAASLFVISDYTEARSIQVGNICADFYQADGETGFISLMGISTRNGMLLISRYNKLRDDGESLSKRIAHGSSDRLLPIVMTALTSALALIPLAVNGDAPGNEIQAPMAIVILGGLLSSTVLNIYIVPMLYRLLNRKEK